MSEEQIKAAAHKKALRAYNKAYKAEYERLLIESRQESYQAKETTLLEKFRKPAEEPRSFWKWLFYA